MRRSTQKLSEFKFQQFRNAFFPNYLDMCIFSKGVWWTF